MKNFNSVNFVKSANSGRIFKRSEEKPNMFEFKLVEDEGNNTRRTTTIVYDEDSIKHFIKNGTMYVTDEAGKERKSEVELIDIIYRDMFDQRDIKARAENDSKNDECGCCEECDVCMNDENDEKKECASCVDEETNAFKFQQLYKQLVNRITRGISMYKAAYIDADYHGDREALVVYKNLVDGLNQLIN